MGKIITVILFLFTTLQLQSQVVMDSVVIYDYKTANKFIRKSGVSPTYVKLGNLDTLILDANNIRTKKLTYPNRLGNALIPPLNYFLVGVKVFFPKDSTLQIHVKAANSFAKKNFSVDTVLTITKKLKKPLFFWAMLRQRRPREFWFKPKSFTVTNQDFNLRKIKHKRTNLMLDDCIRFTYNTTTNELIDKWEVK